MYSIDSTRRRQIFHFKNIRPVPCGIGSVPSALCLKFQSTFLDHTIITPEILPLSESPVRVATLTATQLFKTSGKIRSLRDKSGWQLPVRSLGELMLMQPYIVTNKKVATSSANT